MPTLIGSSRIYYDFKIKSCSPFSILFLQVQVTKKTSLTVTNIIAPSLQVESSAAPLLTIDEVEKVQSQRIAIFIGHVFQLSYAAMVDKLIQQEKLNRFYGFAIQHPSQNQHSCLMTDFDDAWMCFHDEKVEKNDLKFSAESYRKCMHSS